MKTLSYNFLFFFSQVLRIINYLSSYKQLFYYRMSCRSFGHEKSSFTPYQEPMDQKQISLFSRMNLNQKDQISLEGPLRNQIQYEASDLFSMRSRKRKGSAEIQLKQSLPGNRTYLNMSLIGKSSLRNQELFAMDREQDLGIQFHEDDDKKQLSQKSCPVGVSSYHFEQNSANLRIKQEPKPKFLKTKNLLRTVSSYFHKHLLYNARSYQHQKKYFLKFVQKKKKAIYFGLNLNQKNEEQLLFQKLNQLNKSETRSPKNKIKVQYQSEDQNYYNSVMSSQQEKSLEVNSCTKAMKRNKGQKMTKQKKKLKQQKNLVQCFKKLKVKLEQQAFQQSSHMHNEGQQCNQKFKVWKQFQEAEFKQKTCVYDQDVQEEIQKFHFWVSNHSIINFVDYQNIWTNHHSYLSIYRQLCYKYYKEQLYCDIMRSRLSIKDVSNKCMWQFVQGLFHPKSFYRFK